MKNILFIDSGSGGINILSECYKDKLCGNFLYYADEKNAPYGDKSVFELKKIIVEILDKVQLFFDYQIVVFACNTLTTSVISYVRAKYPNIIFIGTVPATKTAFEKYSKNDVFVMATNRTLENLKLNGICVPNLPKLIDENLLSLDELEDYLFSQLSDYGDKKCVVLGCTHYMAVKKIIQKVLPNCEIIDSGKGVCNRLKTFTGTGESIVQIMSSENYDNAVLSRYFLNNI